MRFIKRLANYIKYVINIKKFGQIFPPKNIELKKNKNRNE